MMEKLLGLPVLASEHGKEVDNLIIYVHILMIALFIGWLAYFAYALFRFHHKRNPKADYIGVKNHASNWIEGAVAVVEGFLLIFIAVPLWAKAVDTGFPKESDAIVLHVVAQQFAWNVHYPGKDGKFGPQHMNMVAVDNAFGLDMKDPATADDVLIPNEIHCVTNKPVIIYITSKDVIHSFKIIAMRVTQDAIPGQRVPIHFIPTKEGHYQINCAQLCGNAHSAMSSGYVVVETQEKFDKWLEGRPKVGASAGGNNME
jgi:cytochrome c oxidase subunit 2